MAWADTVKVARVRPAMTADPAESKRSLQIVASLQMDYLIAVSISACMPVSILIACIMAPWDLCEPSLRCTGQWT
jgi:hypothetical protein